MGFMFVIEEMQFWGILLVIDQINDSGGINGCLFEFIIYDLGLDMCFYGQLVKWLMVVDEVSMIFGCYMLVSWKLVFLVVEWLNGLLWYLMFYEGFEFLFNVIYIGVIFNQNSMQFCSLFMKLYGDCFFFIGFDYIYLWEFNCIMCEMVVWSGGSVVGECYVCFGVLWLEFELIMQEIKFVKFDVIFLMVVGDGIVFFYQVYFDKGFDLKKMLIVSFMICEVEIVVMGYDVGEGYLIVVLYFQGIDNNQNSEFVKSYQK